MRESDPARERLLRGALEAQVDRQLQRPGVARAPCGAIGPICWPSELTLHGAPGEAAVQDAVVGRLDARLTDVLAGLRPGVAARRQLGPAQLSEQAEEAPPSAPCG